MLNNRLNCINFLIIPISWLITILLVSPSFVKYALILVAIFVNALILIRKLKWFNLIFFALLLLPGLISFFTSNYLYSSNQLSLTQQLNQGLILSLRLGLLAITSFIFIYHMPKETVIRSMARRRLIPVKIAFSLLAVFNAFGYLKEEFNRIKLAYQMRYQKFMVSPKIIFPLLVAAARYAHSLSISMYTRGLNQGRSYYDSADQFSIYDLVLWVFNISFVTGIVLIN